MALFENFPYTNFHEMNLDWLLHRVKALETLANAIEDDYVVFQYSSGSYSKILGKTAYELYDDIAAGKNVKGVILKGDGVEYSYKVEATKTLGKAQITFIFTPEIKTSLTEGQISVAYGRKIALTQAMPRDSVSYNQTDVEVAIVTEEV